MLGVKSPVVFLTGALEDEISSAVVIVDSSVVEDVEKTVDSSVAVALVLVAIDTSLVVEDISLMPVEAPGFVEDSAGVDVAAFDVAS